LTANVLHPQCLRYVKLSLKYIAFSLLCRPGWFPRNSPLTLAPWPPLRFALASLWRSLPPPTGGACLTVIQFKAAKRSLPLSKPITRTSKRPWMIILPANCSALHGRAQPGWLDTYAGRVVRGLANGITIFLFRQSFAQIPRELTEAARIDGAGGVTILWCISVPLCKPVIIGAGLLIFPFQWEAFLWRQMVTRSANMRVVQVALSGSEKQHQTLWNELFAPSVIFSAILLLILLSLQRYYIREVAGCSING
jgi:hypothetical protein